jgi:phosphatidylglycerol:prolipoprotein diacylglycerol transferase
MITWNVSPIIVEVGFFKLRYYSLMFVLGFLLMGEYVKHLFKKYGKDPELVSSLTTHIIFGMLIGSRLVHCLFYEPEQYLSDPIEILKIWEGGLASHGGYLGVFVAVAIFLRKHKDLSFLWIMDIISGPCLFVGGLIRVGNLFNSEIVGEPTNVPWAFIFERVDNIPRHPAQIYEAIGYFTVAFILCWMEKKKFLVWAQGSIISAALILSFMFRFLIEFLKGEQSSLSVNFPINMGQILSLVCVACGVVLWMIVNKNKKVPMKVSVAALIWFCFSTLSFAEDIKVVRNGELTVKVLNSYTTIVNFSVKAIMLKPELAEKYVIISNGAVLSPVSQGNCRAYQVYQTSIYRGELSPISIAVQDSTGQGNCPDLLKKIQTESLMIQFKTALLGDGSGKDVGPVSVSIK